ncbi:GNAT family N-acetyltransferase [Enterococcus ureasiticus]|uniref:GNAT family N-acetyltransferase n=1 Tax=Enterococcus ureasiticus TaxID=903984 RepID=UPI001A8E3B00|nr:GNAT family N-acetyltransferase [Enterococcus ureasiticus]MBO0475251.1 GNAT family N-acetyltransferase [Enterococcus ureasiticus]
MIKLTNDKKNLFDYYINNLAELAPYFHLTTKQTWKKSCFEDTDFEGKQKFKELFTVVAREDEQIEGFIQFGLSSYGYDENGEKDFLKPIAVIRQIYFSERKETIGQKLINEALNYFKQNNFSQYYAFFHALGMSFTSSHGKLSKNFDCIENLLLNNGFKIEHANVYYRKILQNEFVTKNKLILKHDCNLNECTDNITFLLETEPIGKCNIFYLPDGKRVYLRWIFLADEFQNKGYGSQSMKLLCKYLYQKNCTELHTDTADSNFRAQRYYLKNNFSDLGRTRSYLV